MLPITRLLITHPVTRPFLKNAEKYRVREVRAVVAHWTANKAKGANALANRNYFNNGSPGPGGKLRAASAHYCVDDKSIVQCLPEYEVAYHVGAVRYRPAGYELFKGHPGLSPNYFTIGYEMCVNADSDWETTRANSIDLACHLLVKHGLSIHGLIRHFDVTGKDCPKMFVETQAWSEYKAEVLMVYQQYAIEGAVPMVVTSKGLNVRKGPGTAHEIRYELAKGERVVIFPNRREGDWIVVGQEEWVNFKYLSPI